ncbi:uncharacterized protein N7518_004432 [Penicillium psychrosexuale]|uniref:uncharacterized protein n=1 Tax=Penicillium psychrosexuale TaxID=1002107 RepID=UPI00254565EB|nr:uncharacterized protein N7518_004432 [Penicillium psychrosexuale]KAJ5795892.1 hypothetical protein N7518_004432 [Penicillium psychrosexuale]
MIIRRYFLPFYDYIIELLKIKEVTTYLTFKIYNTLFNHFNQAEALLKQNHKKLTTGASIKRLFNTTRDICYYYRGRLKSKTIKELILYRYITKFSIKDTKIKELQQLLSLAEAKVKKEESANFLEDSKYNLISNNKEEEEEGGGKVIGYRRYLLSP